MLYLLAFEVNMWSSEKKNILRKQPLQVWVEANEILSLVWNPTLYTKCKLLVKEMANFGYDDILQKERFTTILIMA